MAIQKPTRPLTLGGSFIYPKTSSDQVIMDDGSPLQVGGVNSSVVDSVAKSVLNYVYPIGSIYTSLVSTSPATLFGGSWERIKDTFLLSAGDSYKAGDVGGEAEHKLTTEEMPEHTHERGTMDITGYLKCYSQYNKGNDDYWTTGSGGAFYKDPDNYVESASTLNQSDSASSDSARTVSFKASRAWTGETSNAGGSAAHNNMPPYLAVYMWKRTA